jgi:hypothetical protein
MLIKFQWIGIKPLNTNSQDLRDPDLRWRGRVSKEGVDLPCVGFAVAFRPFVFEGTRVEILMGL